jgi:hypothetical protein
MVQDYAVSVGVWLRHRRPRRLAARGGGSARTEPARPVASASCACCGQVGASARLRVLS